MVQTVVVKEEVEKVVTVEVPKEVEKVVTVREPVRQKLDRNRRSRTFEFRVADCKGFVTVAEYTLRITAELRARNPEAAEVFVRANAARDRQDFLEAEQAGVLIVGQSLISPVDYLAQEGQPLPDLNQLVDLFLVFDHREAGL